MAEKVDSFFVFNQHSDHILVTIYYSSQSGYWFFNMCGRSLYQNSKQCSSKYEAVKIGHEQAVETKEN